MVIRDQALVVNWNPPVSDGGAAIDDYDVQYRPHGNANTDWTVVDPADGQERPAVPEITGLTNMTTYEIQVRAVNGSGRRGLVRQRLRGAGLRRYRRSHQLCWSTKIDDTSYTSSCAPSPRPPT